MLGSGWIPEAVGQVRRVRAWWRVCLCPAGFREGVWEMSRRCLGLPGGVLSAMGGGGSTAAALARMAASLRSRTRLRAPRSASAAALRPMASLRAS